MRRYVRIVGANRIDDAAVAAAIVDVTCAASRMPFPRLTHSELSHTEQKQAVSGPLMDMDPGSSHLILKPEQVRSGDLVVVHPYLTKEDTGGCVGVVLRHSPLDTLILVVNVDAGIDLEAPWNEQVEYQKSFRPVWRLHAYLPPIAPEDPRQFLPPALRNVPLSWGGRYPTPLHLLHSVPLDVPAVEQSETFQRVSGHQILPGLWCSFADGRVVEAAAQKLETGESFPENFGGFIGMECLQPGKLREYMRMNHWFVIRPGGVVLPPQGWRCSSPVVGKWDDLNWAPWRAALTSVGGEFRDWAEVDWAAVASH